MLPQLALRFIVKFIANLDPETIQKQCVDPWLDPETLIYRYDWGEYNWLKPFITENLPKARKILRKLNYENMLEYLQDQNPQLAEYFKNNGKPREWLEYFIGRLKELGENKR